MLSRMRLPTRHVAMPVLLGAAYLLAYLGVDWVSYIHPLQGLNITPWNPQAALAVVFLVWRPRSWWLVWLALVAAEVVVRGPPSPWPVEAWSCGALTAGYALLARVVVARLGRPPRLAQRADFAAFVAIVAVGALANALLYVGALVVAGEPPPSPLAMALGRYWIGDVLGLLVTLPLLFALGDPLQRGLAAALARSRECWLVGAGVTGLALLLFRLPDGDQFKFFYVLFVPLVWLAARFGLPGAAWGSAWVQLLLVAGVQSMHLQTVAVFELQLLMATLAGTGLLIGVAVDEREALARELRASLQLAASGQAAAALAHELNQPLTAIAGYARASQLLAQRLAGGQAQADAPLLDAVDKLVGEVGRAAAVVRRLRDFFRQRSTALQLVAPQPLLDAALDAQRGRAQALGVALALQVEAPLPALWIDEVQIGVVLRNLVVNAVDAALQGGAPRQVALRAQAAGGELRLQVLDSGPGVPAERSAAVFEPRRSDKPEGMGIGLGICRAIVEAHGGRLWCEPAAGGRFCLVLPLAGEADHG